MRGVRDIPKLENVPVLVRAAFNVPVENGEVTNDYRLRRALPTLKFLAKAHARVVVVSHLGEKGTETLAPVARALEKLTQNIHFCPETIGLTARNTIRDLSPGHILVLENLRRDRREVGNDPAFAKELASLADVFVQDSFDTCHREHASIVGVPKLLPSYAGLLLEEEVLEISKACSPRNPALAIIGGAKFSTKEPVLRMLLSRYDHVFVGGALANDFLHAEGKPVGKSLVSGSDGDAIRELLKNERLVLPVDSRVVRKADIGTPRAHENARVATLDDVAEDEVILDHGPATAALLIKLAQKSRAILWNGPLGKYEDGFVDTTVALAKAVAETGAFSLVGGGDTIGAIEKLGLLSRFSFVSTGGGAMLDLLAKGSLPGVAALG